MHARDVISGTLLVAGVMVVLGVVGWQTVANNSAIEKLGAKLEARREWSATRWRCN